ncbi:MAG: chorismate mutase [Candidatus Woesearchaeota archaeon]
MSLEDFRNKIDKIDSDILSLISDRFSVVEDMAEYKKHHKIPIIDVKYDEESLKKRISIAKAKKLDEAFAERVFKDIFEESKRIQRQIF